MVKPTLGKEIEMMMAGLSFQKQTKYAGMDLISSICC